MTFIPLDSEALLAEAIKKLEWLLANVKMAEYKRAELIEAKAMLLKLYARFLNGAL